MNNLIMHLKPLENKTRTSQNHTGSQKEATQTRAGINGIGTKKQYND
jgi:hypothetical protein